MIKTTGAGLLCCIIFLACSDSKTGKEKIPDNRIALYKDSLNRVKRTDTLIIYESTCRGCAYEASTAFAVKDSLGLVQLAEVETIDNNPPGMDGGNISKNLVLVPVKNGKTILKVYKFWEGVPSHMTDSLPFSAYPLEIQN